MTLYSFPQKYRCMIESLPQIGLLKALGLREGLTLSVLTKQPFGGPVVVQIGTRSFAIAKEVAQQIVVQEVI